MHPRKTQATFLGQNKRGILHTQWGEQFCIQIVLENLTARSFNRLAGPVDADSVFPSFARIKAERQVETGIFASQRVWSAGLFQVSKHIGIEEVIAKTRGVREQVP